jgi:ribonucleotide reductase beta subunit family protein with ferritin-like domain
MSKLFTDRIAYKPFEFPDYYNEGWLKQMQAFWLHTEIPMQGDIKDWNEFLVRFDKNMLSQYIKLAEKQMDG